jgi:hypothetical protein
MIGNNNFYFNYNNFLLNNNNFISPSQNVGINNTLNKKLENSTKTNSDTASFSQDTEINENDNNNALNSLFGSLSNIANSDINKSKLVNSNFNSRNFNNDVDKKDNQRNLSYDLIFSSNDPHTPISYPSPFSKPSYAKDAIKDLEANHIDSIKSSANKAKIDDGLLFGILVAEQMRFSWFEDGILDHVGNDKSKGLAQIKDNAALEGEIFYRNHNKNKNDNIDTTDSKAIEKLKSEIKENIFNNDKNIEYSAKYISFLQSQFPQKNGLNKEEQYKLIAAAYKAGPEAVKNARMQEQLNDLLNLKGNNKLTTDGDPGTKTKNAIDKLISNTLPFAQMSYKDGDYSKIREVINLIWEKKHPDEKNPPGAVPIYENNETLEWYKRADLSVKDVMEAKKLYDEFY